MLEEKRDSQKKALHLPTYVSNANSNWARAQSNHFLVQGIFLFLIHGKYILRKTIT